MTFKKLTLSLLALSLVACAPGTNDGDLPFEGDGSAAGKADAVSIELTPIRANIGRDRLERGGKVIITSADSWLDYFGTEAPADVDFGREWVAFFGSGLHNTGGYGAEIRGLFQIAGGGVILETVSTSPGFDCFVTQAFTTPHSVVKFTVPSRTPRWALSDHSDEVHRCGPTTEERQAELAESLSDWKAARDEASNSYTYVRDSFSFLGNLGFQTTLVVENGVVVERIGKSTSGNAPGETLQFHEVGDEVGTNIGFHPAVLIDDLYAQCKNDVLSLDDQEHFINLSFEGGLLQSCTSFHRSCQDDCSRGPVITRIEL